jgi:hypothetical protein
VDDTRSLCRGPEALKALGDFRRLTDTELLAKPGIGARLFAHLSFHTLA